MKKLILDIDTGIDDAIALGYAISSCELDLIGVVGTYGNVYPDTGIQNVLNILDMFGETKVDVYKGETHALKKDDFVQDPVSAKIHGQNGVGEVEFPKSSRTMNTKNGIDFMYESIQKYGDDLVIVATGPMTNLASLIEKHPDVKEKMCQVVIMGGAYGIEGNVTPYAEANIWQDPYAAKVLFESGIEVTMVGLDVTERCLLNKKRTQEWRETGEKGKLYADMMDYYIDFEDDGETGYLHDPAALICAIHPEYFTYLPMHLTTIIEGEASGRTVADRAHLRDANPNVKVCIGVDNDLLVNHLHDNLMNLFKNNK